MDLVTRSSPDPTRCTSHLTMPLLPPVRSLGSLKLKRGRWKRHAEVQTEARTTARKRIPEMSNCWSPPAEPRVFPG